MPTPLFHGEFSLTDIATSHNAVAVFVKRRRKITFYVLQTLIYNKYVKQEKKKIKMNVARYLTMKCTIKHTSDSIDKLTGMRETVKTETEVDCFKDEKHALYRDRQGEMNVSNTRVYLLVEVKPGDFIDGFEIKDVQRVNNFDGTVSHYEAVL